MSPVDEGLIHAWLEGQLPDAEAKRVADLVAADPAWSAAAAEARGLIAGASRVLGALDHVPSVGSARSVRAAPRAWWREPWVRAAAALVLVAGTATAVWQNMPGEPNDALSMAPVTATAPAESKAAVAPDSVRPPAAEPVRESTTRPTVPPPAGERVADAARPPAAMQDAARQGKSAADVADTSAVAANEARRVAAGDSGASGRAIRGVTVTAPPVALVEQGVVGAVRRDQARDARLAGCWARIDTTGAMTSFAVPGRELAAASAGIMAMRFIGPVVTDVVLPGDTARRSGVVGGAGRGGGRAAGTAGGNALAQRAEARERPAIIGPFNATARMLPDSSYVAEFIDELGRADLSFRVSGDTLRGTMRRSAADVRYPATELRAVRVACPR